MIGINMEFVDDFNVSRRIMSHDEFWVGSDSVFINYFGINRRMYVLMNSTSAAELDCADDSWVSNDSVFVNDFQVQ